MTGAVGATGAQGTSGISGTTIDLINDNSVGATITGTIVETQCRAGILIPANTFALGDEVIVSLMMERISSPIASGIIRLRVGATNVFSSSTIIAMNGQSTTGWTYPLVRNLSFKTATTFDVVNQNNVVINDLAQTVTSAPVVINFNVANINYFHFGIVPGNVSDLFRITKVRISKITRKLVI